MFTRKRWRRMTAVATLRRQIQRLSPYQSLIVMLLPIMLVEPLKIVAVFVAGDGHWLTGTAIMVAAYTGSLLLVERLFKIVKPKLMMLNWFARLWIWFSDIRRKVSSSLRGLPKQRLAGTVSEPDRGEPLDYSVVKISSKRPPGDGDRHTWPSD